MPAKPALTLTDGQKKRFDDLKAAAVRNHKNGGYVQILARDLRLLVFVGLHAQGDKDAASVDPGPDKPEEETDDNVKLT